MSSVYIYKKNWRALLILNIQVLSLFFALRAHILNIPINILIINGVIIEVIKLKPVSLRR